MWIPRLAVGIKNICLDSQVFNRERARPTDQRPRLNATFVKREKYAYTYPHWGMKRTFCLVGVVQVSLVRGWEQLNQFFV